ncbi:MAG: 50S ribosomal protein L10 [Coriobacteriia bacterium]|nr:50S ribosomal protein L10 [Coriobacteriia bacterium]
MPNAEKVKILAQVTKDLADADAVWVMDYRGMTVKQEEQLRKLVRTNNASFKVYKNSFTERALRDLDMPSMNAILSGPSGFVFVFGDPVASAKAIKGFIKEQKKFEIKGGLLNGTVVTADQVKAVADLPSREELLARLLGTMANPMSSLVRVLNGPAEKFVRTLQAIIDDKAA